MSTDKDSIPQGLLNELIRGLRLEQDGPMVDQIKDPISVSNDSGKITITPSRHELARDEGELLEAGSDIDSVNDELDSVSYNIKSAAKKSVVEDRILDHIQSATGRDEMRRKLSRLRRDTFVRMDSVLESELSDTSTKNQSLDVTTTGTNTLKWSDTSSAPFEDVEEAFDKNPEADTLIIGRTDEKNLKRNADVLAEFSNFNAGQLGGGQLANVFMEKFPRLETVMVANSGIYSNSDAEGTGSFTLQKHYDTTWLGSERGIVYVEYDEGQVRQYRDEAVAGGGATGVVYERQFDLFRPSKLSELGVTFTNTS